MIELFAMYAAGVLSGAVGYRLWKRRGWFKTPEHRDAGSRRYQEYKRRTRSG